MQNTKNKRSLYYNKVVARYTVYNGLFLDLPYSQEENVGSIIPILHSHVAKGLENKAHPVDIMNDFFSSQLKVADERARIDFMFRVIQYIERQVVLFDSVEDASFSEISNFQNAMGISDYLKLARNEGKEEDIVNKLKEFSARLVFTAHPTQFYPPEVLDIISDLRLAIAKNDIENIDRYQRQLGLTSLLNSDKPTPLDEAKNIIYYLRHIYYDAIGEIFKSVSSLFPNDDFENYNLVRLGFWPGGDRDGNPFVTYETTLQVADELRMTLMKCYYNDVKGLQRKLTFKKILKPISELRKLLYEAIFNSNKIIQLGQILDPLYQMKSLLVSDYHGIYEEDVDDFIHKVKIFKTHFATIDIRQDHSIHQQVIQEILIHHQLIKENIDELNKEELKEILLKKDLDIAELVFQDPIVSDTIKSIGAISDIQNKNGIEGCERYIISNSEDVFSVLYVHAMLRWYYKKADFNVDVIPLFETMKGMDDSSEIMKELFDTPLYQKHLKFRGNKQTMMLGFSDGTKDGGYLKANWSIHQTKERLTEICRKNSIKPIFFDGRGGPPARGGGKTHRFYASQGQTVADHEIQLTIQGQTITSIYGTPEQFTYNSQQLVTAALANELHGEKAKIDGTSRTIIDQLADISFEKYTSLKNHPKFLNYLEFKSTLKYYGLAKIGSRPGKRGKSQKLTLKDLRAISFVGSWNQLKQNIPGFFGIGSALNQLKQSGKITELKNLFNEVKWFKALMLNSMMALSKSNFNLTAYMKDDEEYGEFWKVLHDEYKLSKEMLLEISGYKELMQEEFNSKQSIAIREKIVLPLLVIQQYALIKISEEDSQKEVYEKIVTRSLFGNINASRNSA